MLFYSFFLVFRGGYVVLAPTFFHNGYVSKPVRVKLSTVEILFSLILGGAPVFVLFLVFRFLTLSQCGVLLLGNQDFRILVITVTATIGILVSLLIIGIRRLILLPIKKLTAGETKFSSGDPPLVRESYCVSEIHELAHSINDMIEEVMSREEILRDLNESLEEKILERTRAHEETIETLRSTRDRLLVSEKMSALGALVSGVAIEIITPLSIGITAASFLNERTRMLKKRFDDQSLTQEDLERFFTDSEESSGIIQNNLDRTMRIITSLKQVASDQQSDQRRKFELGSYLNDVEMSMKHLLKPGKHELIVEPDGLILMNTYPGTVSRIVNDLVQNSITHGFHNIEGGKIRIGCREEGEDAIIEYRDNGRGLTEEEYRRLSGMEPAGVDIGVTGCGLGMSIVRKLVKRLGGSFAIDPSADKGVHYILKVPKKPGEEET